MLIVLFLLAVITIAHGQEEPKTFQNCNAELCNGKADGNYAIKDALNHFVQCVDKRAYCQSCWPQSLVFKEECNQCLYHMKDKCQSTSAWVTRTRQNLICRDLCPSKGPTFKGNIADPDEKRHYAACWYGVTVGCVDCPDGLLFNEEEQACLFQGKYITNPTWG